jgi:hypothetical protein
MLSVTQRIRGTVALVVAGVLLAATARGRAGATALPSAPAHRIALLPVDDRPVNLQDVSLAAATAGMELVTPPRSRLGGRDIEGDADGLVEWLDGLDASRVDAVVLSLDMLAYGGTDAARRPATPQAKALDRLAAIRRLAARRPGLQVLAYGGLLPLAPPAEPRRAEVLGKLERWASLAGTHDAAEATERDRLRGELPDLVLTPYLAARTRNQAVTMAAIDLAAAHVISYLVLESEEAEPKGLSKEEREAIEARRASPQLEGRTALTSRTDGMAGLLVARAVNAVLGREPGVEASSEGAVALAAIAGAHRVSRAGPHDLVVQVVLAPNAGTAADAVTAIQRRVHAGDQVAVADATGGAGTPGSSIPLIEALRNAHLFPRLAAYAGEGAADPTIAAALSQGLLATAGMDASAADAHRLASARTLAMLHRVVVDFLYQAVVRPQAMTDYAPEHHMNGDELDADQVLRMQDYLTGEVKPLAESLVGDFAVAPPRTRRATVAPIKDIDDFRLTLPWRRMSDPEIRFTIVER